MTIQTRTTLKTYFNTGDKPTEAQFSDLIDSSLNIAETASQTIKSPIVVSGAATFKNTLSVDGVTTLSGGGTSLTVSADTNDGSIVTTACLTSAISGFVLATAVSALSRLSSFNVQVFVSSGTYVPTTGLLYAEATAIGGGGAGGGVPTTAVGQIAVGGGGGSGQESIKYLTAAQLGASQTITIGAAGSAAAGTTGGDGGTTSIGVLITAAGGSGGQAGSAGSVSLGTGGSGGSGGTSDIASTGPTGDMGFGASTTAFIGGKGADSRFGSGGKSQANGSAAGNAASGYGAGGAGATQAANQGVTLAGGNGSKGCVIIREYIGG